MADISAGWGGDLGTSTTGDLVMVETPQAGTERVLRRLLTNPGAYVWHKEYGAGLARFVGQKVDEAAVQAVIRGQMLLEPAVASDPEPVVAVRLDEGGSLFVQVRYADAQTSAGMSLNFQVAG